MTWCELMLMARCSSKAIVVRLGEDLGKHLHMERRRYRIAVLPGDGIGQEVMSVAIKVLEKVSENSRTFDLEFEHFDWSTQTYLQTGSYIPNNGLEQLKSFDALLFGAVGSQGKLGL